ncbi:hypothetical protein SAMN05444008_1031 [Cnuella takakiae]|uniref:Uncharacterized protein n=1 Tax=Cnuella takakiae TaxID=1302690 RepID=A0A1M4WED1_9BACT|nr:hypothetical protein [Cnuella takakiae]OLY91742.1 hypothetical protein BUE76_07390 [Cnuella takakiae]SHE79564.1 hypothetical protein SAMN05444008_1031 [Cnuella takakiae]
MTKFYLIAFLLFFAACKSPQKIYDQGNFDAAIERAVKKLQRDPNDAASRRVVKDAYEDAVAQQESEIRNLLATAGEERFIQVYRKYNYLQGLYHTISQSPVAQKTVQPTDYTSYLATYRDKAAELYVERGRRYAEADSKRGYQEAWRAFRAAQDLKPGDPEIRSLVADAYREAITVVMVLPMDSYGSNYYFSNSSFQLRNFQDRLIRQLNYSTNDDFIKYYSEWDAMSRDMRPDQLMEMRLGRMRFGQPFDRTESRKVQKEVVVKETVYKKDSVVKEYATVSATIYTTHRTLISEAGLLLTSRDPNGRILWNDEFGGQHRWEVKLVTWKGDERALSDADKQYINNNQPGDQRVPREDEIVDELLRQILNDLALRLRSNYRKHF